MLRRFLAYIEKKQLLSPTDRVLLSVSGGMDSVLLCHLFAASPYRFGIAHCNYTLRGAASEAEEDFTRQLATQLQVPFYHTTFPTQSIAAERKQSIQEVARDLRYEWLEATRQTHDYDYIATAHHLSDSIETLLFNLGRGGGIRALHGIQPKSEKLLHPMLFATKTEIETYLIQQHIPWQHDASNDTDKYSRNKIRHQIVPVFRELYPSFEQKAGETIDYLNEVEAIFNWSIAYFKSQLLKTTNQGSEIDLALLHSYPAPNTILYELLKDFGFHSDQIQQILDSSTGSQFYSASHRAVLDRERLVIQALVAPTQATYQIETFISHFSFESHVLKFELLDTPPQEFIHAKNIAYLDYDQLQFPLQLRHWQPGDRFQPIGMQGKSKKLQDYFSDLKLNRFAKAEVWLLLSGEQICWVVDYRLDERYKLSAETKNVLRIEWLK
ncbi:MAG: tRNA lysidine(34) synthetase TilS [Bacteroidota bacterium]